MPPKEKSKELKHRNIICLKLTDIELEILNQAASSVGISRSEYLRRLFLNKPIQINYEVVADIKLLRELVGRLIDPHAKGIGSYHHANFSALPAFLTEVLYGIIPVSYTHLCYRQNATGAG